METFAPPQGPAGWGHPALRTPGRRRPSLRNANFIRRGGIYPARGRSRRRGVRRDEGIPPYGRPEGGGRPCETQILFVGAGFIPPGGVRAAAGCGGMRASRPTAARKAAAVPVWPQTQNLFVGADSISARGHLRRRRAPGTISGLRAGPAARLASETRLRAQCEHRPLQGFVVMRGRSFPVGRRIRRRPQGPAPQKQNTTNLPPCRISIATARPRTASKL